MLRRLKLDVLVDLGVRGSEFLRILVLKEWCCLCVRMLDAGFGVGGCGASNFRWVRLSLLDFAGVGVFFFWKRQFKNRTDTFISVFHINLELRVEPVHFDREMKSREAQYSAWRVGICRAYRVF